MREDIVMVHDAGLVVNALYVWRSPRGLTHLAVREAVAWKDHLTLCGKSVGVLTYAGLEGVSTAKITCLTCVLRR